MKYLKLFDTHSEYEEFAGGGGMLKPNVSHCVQENEVHYNPIPHDYSKDYLTIESLEDNNTIYLKASNIAITKTVSASTDNGETWTEYTSSTENSGTTLATLNKGNKLLIKGENGAYADNRFIATKQIEVKGNIMSLINGDSFTNAHILAESSTFRYLFYQCTGLTSAENLIIPATTLTSICYQGMFYGCTNLTTAPALPATTLANGCYTQMFKNCTSLTTAPELPATTLTGYCYANMFAGCTNLNYIKAMFTTTPSTDYTEYWVSGVASSGTFVKNAAAQWNVTGFNGIPTGWTVQTASA